MPIQTSFFDSMREILLLPRNGYIQLQNTSVSIKSWTEVNSEGLRILFVKSDLSHSGILKQLRALIVRVKRRKYKVSLNSSLVY